MISSTDLRTVVERLERIERQNRRLKRAGITVVLALGAILLMGQAAPDSAQSKHRNSS